jgi:hypothetical protein
VKRLALLATIALAACGTSDDDGGVGGDSTLTINNDSSYALIGIYLSPTTSVSWGNDLLGNEVLVPGEVFEVSGIECDTYDIRVVDEDNDECILDSVDLCLDNAVWHIDNAELGSCGF